VIRGYKLPSIYAPEEGYRYDGLYIVERAWMAKGLTNGLLVCRYAFKRIPGQPALPEKVDEPVTGSDE
jgi:E3 ubiquitin-protein ligase UHRF1